MPTTMTDVARRLNLSQATVSLVLNKRDKNRVRPELAERIRQTAREMGYRPNRVAGELRRGKSRNIGVLLPSPRYFFSGEMVADLHREICRRDYSPVFAFWDNDDEQEDALDSILSWHTAAIITVEPGLLPQNFKVPAVSFYNSDPRFDLVELDFELAVTQVLECLHGLGHRRIAWLGHEDRRYELYLKQCKHWKIELPEACRVFNHGILSFIEGSRNFDQLLAQTKGGLPTALVAHNDMSAIGIMRRAVELGYRIPEDFSIIGQDDIAQAQFCIPSLSSIHYAHSGSIGSVLVEMVFKRLENPGMERQILRIPPKLVIRESCGKAATVSTPTGCLAI